jgi:hypothetical protein
MLEDGENQYIAELRAVCVRVCKKDREKWNKFVKWYVLHCVFVETSMLIT